MAHYITLAVTVKGQSGAKAQESTQIPAEWYNAQGIGTGV